MRKEDPSAFGALSRRKSIGQGGRTGESGESGSVGWVDWRGRVWGWRGHLKGSCRIGSLIKSRLSHLWRREVISSSSGDCQGGIFLSSIGQELGCLSRRFWEQRPAAS